MTTGSTVAAPAYPTRRDDAWRYAPHRVLADLTFGPSTPEPAGSLPSLGDRVPPLDGPRIVVVNGIVDLEHSHLVSVDGVTVSALAAASQNGSHALARHRELVTGGDAFAAFSVEYGVDGAVIEVAPGVASDTAIHVVDVAIPNAERNMSCTGVTVHVGAGSSATVVETRIGDGDSPGGSNIRTTVTLEPGATLDHIVVQDLPATQVQLGSVHVSQAADSTYRSTSFNLGALYGRLEVRVELSGAGALADLSGLYFGVGDQTLDQQVTVVHAVENCTSRQTFRGVLDDQSIGVFNGGIEVRPGADGSDAAQTNANLVLSDRAEANSQPRLEILADEVTCTHGSTVGQLDDTALYYLRSRGIPVDAARRLLINAFADQVVDGVGIEEVRAWITRRLGHDDDA